MDLLLGRREILDLILAEFVHELTVKCLPHQVVFLSQKLNALFRLCLGLRYNRLFILIAIAIRPRVRSHPAVRVLLRRVTKSLPVVLDPVAVLQQSLYENLEALDLNPILVAFKGFLHRPNFVVHYFDLLPELVNDVLADRPGTGAG